MGTITTDTLKARYAVLQEERARSWTQAQLESNASVRTLLRSRFDPASVAQVGDVLPPLSFVEVDGETLTPDNLTADGPALMILFRYAGCPACNIALPYYAEGLFPALKDRVIPLVAPNPERCCAK